MTSFVRPTPSSALSPETPLCFLHIPKTAGMTVRQFLLMRFPPGQAYNVSHNPILCEEMPVYGEDLYQLHQCRPHLAYISHVPYHWLRRFPQLPHLFTILREPIDRTLSHYYFLRELLHQGLLQRPHPLVARIAEVEIDQFVREEPDRSRVFFAELQTRWMLRGPCWELQDYDPVVLHRALTERDLRRAKRRLRKCVVVGVAHRLRESLELLCEAFDWPIPDELARENVTEKRPTKEQLDPQTLCLLREMTRFDRGLFDEATQLFERQLARRGKSPPRPVVAEDSFTCTFDQGVPGHGWLTPERADNGWYCWTGKTAWLEFTMRPTSRVGVELDLHYSLGAALYEQMEVDLNGHRVEGTLDHSGGAGPARFRAELDTPNLVAPPGKNRLTIRLPGTVRPSEVMPGHPDTRRLGVAVSRVLVAPARESRSEDAREPAAPETFTCAFDRGIPGQGWLVPERGAGHWYCWTGQTAATLEFALRPSDRIGIDIRLHHALDPALAEQLEIELNDRRIDLDLNRTGGEGGVRYLGVVYSPNLVLAPSRNRLTFRLPRTLKPSEVMPGHPDCRSLGVAFSHVEVRAA